MARTPAAAKPLNGRKSTGAAAKQGGATRSAGGLQTPGQAEPRLLPASCDTVSPPAAGADASGGSPDTGVPARRALDWPIIQKDWMPKYRLTHNIPSLIYVSTLRISGIQLLSGEMGGYHRCLIP